MTRWWQRRRRLTSNEVNLRGWQHPRPPADPRIVWTVIGLAWVSFAQVFLGAPDTSVTARAYTDPAAVSVAVLVVVSCGLLLTAAFCEKQYTSWGFEIAACLGFTVQSALQFVALVSVNDRWWSAATLAWTVFWGAGNLHRGLTLVWRLW